jgi:predicted Holliday junction resolvase-like endonuclease
LHYKNQTGHINEDECIRQLSKRNQINYKKGKMNEKLQNRLREKCQDACNRAKQLILYANPSTNMHIFVEALEKAKKETNNF